MENSTAKIDFFNDGFLKILKDIRICLSKFIMLVDGGSMYFSSNLALAKAFFYSVGASQSV